MIRHFDPILRRAAAGLGCD